MRRLALVFILQLLCAASWASSSKDQCTFVNRAASMQPVVQQLANACQALVNLCAAAPTHKFCVSFTGVEGSEPPKSTHVRLETAYTNWLSDIVSEWFDDDFYQGILDTYKAKGQLFNEESQSLDPVRVALLTHIVAGGSLTWMEIFGDPTRAENLYGEATPAERRDQNATIERTQKNAAIATYVIGAAALALGRSQKMSAFFLKHMPYLSMRFRAATSLVPAFIRTGPAGEVLIQANNGIAPSVAAIGAGAYIIQKVGGLPPSPAHMVQFNYLVDLTMVNADLESAWSALDNQLMGEVSGLASGLGAQFIVGDLGVRYGSKASSSWLRTALSNSADTFDEIAKKNNWALKHAEWAAKNSEWAAKHPTLAKMGMQLGSAEGSILNFERAKYVHTGEKIANGAKSVVNGAKTVASGAKVTPVSAAVGITLTAAVEKSFEKIHVMRLENRLVKNGKDDIVPVLNELFHVFAKSSDSVRSIIGFTRLLHEYNRLDTKKPNGPHLALLRGQMNSYLDPINRPDETGAHFLQKAICRTYATLPPQEKVPKLTKEQKEQIYYEERKNMGGQSWQYIAYISSELYKYGNGLQDYREYLLEIRQQFPVARPYIEDRLKAVDRWIKERDDFIKEFDIYTTPWYGGVKHFFVNTFEKSLKKVEDSVRQAVTIEWLQQDPVFYNYYRCGAALPSDQNSE